MRQSRVEVSPDYLKLVMQVVGFVWGYACQQFIQTVYILGAGVFLACLVSCSNDTSVDI